MRETVETNAHVVLAYSKSRGDLLEDEKSEHVVIDDSSRRYVVFIAVWAISVGNGRPIVVASRFATGNVETYKDFY